MTKEPKDLGIVIENKEVAYWIRIKEKCKEEIETLKKEIEMKELILPVLEKKIKDLKTIPEEDNSK